MWAPVPCYAVLDLRAHVGFETPCFPERNFAAEVPRQNVSHILWKKGQHFLHPCPFYQSPWNFLCNSLVIRLLFHLVFSSLFRLIALYCSCNTSLIPRGISVAPIYSAAILDLPIFLSSPKTQCSA